MSQSVYDKILDILREKEIVKDYELLLINPIFQIKGAPFLNSIALVRLLFEIEERFGIQFTDEDLALDTVENMTDLAYMVELKLSTQVTDANK